MCATPFEGGVTAQSTFAIDSVGEIDDGGEAFGLAEGRGARGRVVRCAGFSLVVSRSESLPGTLQQHVRSKYEAHTDVVRVVIPAERAFAITMLQILTGQAT
jgi:hypothetical protein